MTAAAALTTVLLATACHGPPHPEEKTMQSAPEARAAMQAIVRDTILVTGGAWSSENGDPIPNVCKLPDGSEGVSFSWNQEASGADDPAAVAKAVGAHWKKHDYHVSYREGETTPAATLHSVIGIGPAVQSISVNASKYRQSIHVDSKCGTGDIDGYYEQLTDPSPSAS
jgi:hypothetical protein